MRYGKQKHLGFKKLHGQEKQQWIKKWYDSVAKIKNALKMKSEANQKKYIIKYSRLL